MPPIHTYRPESQLDYPADKVLDYKDLITRKLNYWRAQLVERTAAYHESVARRKIDPKATINTNTGPLTITKIIEIRIPPVIEARACVEVYEAMLEEAVKGTVQERWSDEQVVVPIDLDTLS